MDSGNCMNGMKNTHINTTRSKKYINTTRSKNQLPQVKQQPHHHISGFHKEWDINALVINRSNILP